MSDYGVKLSRPGNDVLTAADAQLGFSSSWPTLKIEYQGSFNVNVNTNTTLYTHNLGYVPMFLAFKVSGGTSTSYNISGRVKASATDIKFFTFGAVGTETYYIIVFRLPILQSFTASIVDRPLEQLSDYDNNYGIKVALDGANTTSTDLRDYVIHSRALTPNIHMVSTGTPNVTPGTYGAGTSAWVATHGLDYTPFTLCYYNGGANDVTSNAGYYEILQSSFGGVSAYRMNFDATTSRFDEDWTLLGGGGPTATVSLVMLKEPFDAIGFGMPSYTVTI